MANLNSIFPISSKDKYTENDIIDFLMTFEDKMIVANSIRVTGTVKILNANGAAPIAGSGVDWAIDGATGIHSAFQSITSSCDELGVISNVNEYPRYVKAKTSATQTRLQRVTDSLNTTELRCVSDASTAAILNGKKYTFGQSFSFKPDIALNTSTTDIPWKKVGACKVSLRLATNNMFLFGAYHAANNLHFELSNIKLEYSTVPDAPLKSPLVFETIHMIKNSLDSSNTSISTRVPAVARSMSVVFHKESQLNTALYNHLQLDVVPDVQRVEFSFNDSTTQYHSFALDTQEEILYNYSQSWGAPAMGKSDISQAMLTIGESYGIGFPFGQFVDLSKSKIGLSILSNVKSGLKFGVFMYFRGILRV